MKQLDLLTLNTNESKTYDCHLGIQSVPVARLCAAALVLACTGTVNGQQASGLPTLLQCEQCADHHKQALAIGRGEGSHYVFSLANGTADGYWVERVDLSSGYVWMAAPDTVPEAVQEFVAELRQNYDPYTGKLEVTRNIPCPPSVASCTAHDFLEEPGVRHCITDRARDNFNPDRWRLGEIARGLGFGPNGVGGEIQLVMQLGSGELHLKIVFDGGSSIMLRWNGSYFEYVPDSARDGQGNEIANNSLNQSLTAVRHNDSERTPCTMARLGAEFTDQNGLPYSLGDLCGPRSSPGVFGDRTIIWFDCSWNSNQQRLTCIKRTTRG